MTKEKKKAAAELAAVNEKRKAKIKLKWELLTDMC